MDSSWNALYKEYAGGSPVWGVIGYGIDKRFKKFVAGNEFPQKAAFDIGCGFGQYLGYLRERGFAVAGLDASEEAIARAKELLGANTSVAVADMLEYEFPKEEYDLIISIETMQHGTKPQIKKLMGDIYNALVPQGKIFIDLPKNGTWATFDKAEVLEPGTVVPIEGPEKGIPHSSFTRAELKSMLSPFSRISLKGDSWGPLARKWIITAIK